MPLEIAYYATTQTEAIRDAAMLVVSQLGWPQPVRVNYINDQVFVGAGIIYADGIINIHAKGDEMIISEIVAPRMARRVVARFTFSKSWSHPGCWQEHLHTLALLLRMPKVLA